ncbi:MAG: OmpA family protein [Salinivirgaceae bacterium]|nr:OmpA family protein [Salinivirgaceae bacterium]
MKHRLFGIGIALIFYSCSLYGQLGIQMLRNPDTSIKEIFFKKEGGIEVLQLRYYGSNNAVGYFVNSTNCFAVSSGVLLSTGMAYVVGSPNMSGNTGVSMGTHGDLDLSQIARGPTFDAAVIMIDFIPHSDSISFDYFFGSEEYPEFVNKGVNDVFAFLIRKKGTKAWKNIALLPNGIPVTVDHINQQRNSQYFISNTRPSPHHSPNDTFDKDKSDLAQYFMFDGFTTVLKAGTKVEQGVQYEMKIAIADVGDDLYDSGVFLAANSFEAVNYIPDIDVVTEKEVVLLSKNNHKIEMRKRDAKMIVDLFLSFDFNAFNISETDKPAVEALAKIILKRNVAVEIHGHTDSVGTEQYNLDLSRSRAQSVAHIFNTGGVDSSFISIKGFGAFKPLVPNSTDQGRKKNRRVEVVFLDKQ